MADQHEGSAHVSVGLLVTLGLGVGAALGLALARRAAQQSHTEISESVEDLKARTQKVLNELTAKLDQAVETLQETIVRGPEES